MENIKIWVENLISMMGIKGDMIPITRHILLVLVAILLAAIAGLLCRKILVPIIMRITAKTEAKWDDVLFNKKVLMSACHIVPAIVIWWLLPLVFFQFPVVKELLTRITAIYIVVMSVKTVLVFLSAIKDLEGEQRTNKQQYLYSFIGVLRLVMIFVAAIIVVSIIIDKDPMKLFAGLGATSAILMLVFQDTIKGLVAGIRLTSNDMLHKGDWITVPKAGADGTVEEMTLTTVKIRNFDNTIITVTPQTLVDDSFQNWTGMQEGDGRRVKRVVYFDYRSIHVVDEPLRQQLIDKKLVREEDIKADSVNLTLFRYYIEAYLKKRSDVNANMTLMVRQLETSQYGNGLPVEFYFFLKNKEWIPYEHLLADIMEYIYATAPLFGLSIYQRPAAP